MDGLGGVLFKYPFRVPGRAYSPVVPARCQKLSGQDRHAILICKILVSSSSDEGLPLAPPQASGVDTQCHVSAAYYALILRSLTVLEGLALTADKTYKLLGKAYPYIAKRILTDDSPELR